MKEDLIRKAKSLVKLAVRGTERRKFKRELQIRKLQDESLNSSYNKHATRLIIFFIDCIDHTGKEHISGGLLSINSLFEETVKLKEIHKSEVLLCTIKNAHLLFRFSSFETGSRIYRYEQLAKYFIRAEEIVVHIPEYLVEQLVVQFSQKQLNFLMGSNVLHVNILNQNIKLMPALKYIHDLKTFASSVTQTTAHERYATLAVREKYGIGLHHFSSFISPERYNFVPYAKKKKRIVFSPDNPDKNVVFIKKIKKSLPGYEVEVINNMTYEEFKRVIEEVKFTFTFGEGLDGYYCETVLTGGICFAVYNDDFFTKDYQDLPTVYSSYELLEESFIDHIRKLDNNENFVKTNELQFNLLTGQYCFTNYQKNIADFYLGNYRFK
jgi:hypothetical protein